MSVLQEGYTTYAIGYAFTAALLGRSGSWFQSIYSSPSTNNPEQDVQMGVSSSLGKRGDEFRRHDLRDHRQ